MLWHGHESLRGACINIECGLETARNVRLVKKAARDTGLTQNDIVVLCSKGCYIRPSDPKGLGAVDWSAMETAYTDDMDTFRRAWDLANNGGRRVVPHDNSLYTRLGLYTKVKSLLTRGGTTR
ncbi:hypothetical protein KIPB_010701 [Kipferlia bialata]|uniref:Uncharacterized protein n=1 Tax=Kipferlia bialata TaxID=797122 RepID=A0A9K3GMR2_9EUKA|nr:hypothetical protein KIPB_010701 [Kipferlia bialata]|eukprot:g10701.t1